MYHNSLLAMHQGPYRTFLTMRKQFYFLNMLPKIQKYIEACTLCQRTKPKNTKQRPYYGRIPIDYVLCENLAVDLKKMPMGILYHEFLLIATCKKKILFTQSPCKIGKQKLLLMHCYIGYVV